MKIISNTKWVGTWMGTFINLNQIREIEFRTNHILLTFSSGTARRINQSILSAEERDAYIQKFKTNIDIVLNIAEDYSASVSEQVMPGEPHDSHAESDTPF